MTITEGIQESVATAKEKGFWENVNVGEKLMLVVSELGEAIEAHRTDKRSSHLAQTVKDSILNSPDNLFPEVFEGYIKDTLEDELADAVIRILDLAGYLGVDLEYHIKTKMRYNKTRPYKHGKQY